MGINDHLNEPQKKNKLTWLLGCGFAALITFCILAFVIIGGFAGIKALFRSQPEDIYVSVNSPSTAISPNESFQIVVNLSNQGRRNVTLSEIELPEELVRNALVTNVVPTASLQFGEMGMTTYPFDLVIAPDGQQVITFDFLALAPGNVQGNITIRTKSTTATAGFRVFITADRQAQEEAPESSDDVNEEPGMMMGTLIPYQSVVQIIALVEVNSELYEGWTGSGTIISEDGLILTNAHVVLSDRVYDVVDLVVAITLEPDTPPKQMFFADVVQVDENLDLAVIKVRSNLDGSEADFESLGIEPVPLGDADALELGDAIVIIGYPGIGGDTITLTRGEVSGFTPQAPYGNRAFIKTSATIAGGNSGGLAANAQGELIGVPTQLGTGDIQDLIVDCRALADTNRDGVIDDRDQCVSTGGFINALRPLSLALPMIESAKAGEVAIIEIPDSESHGEFQPEGSVVFEDDFIDNRNSWALGSDENGGVEIASDQLVISLGVENYIQWTTLPTTYDEIIMTAEAQFIQSTGDGEAGFICGLRNSENFTILEVSEDGFYTIWKYVDDEYVSLVEWTYSDVIDLSVPFTLSAFCGPDRLALAYNDVLLVDLEDENYVPGNIGLIAGTWDFPDVVVGYDRFTIIEP
jgi:S1-C subfamily serine protease